MRHSAPSCRAKASARRSRLTRAMRWAAIGVMAALAVTPYARLQAGTGYVLSLPQPGVRNTTGLTVNVDTRWVDGDGYRPVRVEVIPAPGPAPADRTLRFVFTQFGFRYWEQGVTRIEQTIEVPQGSTRVEATVAIPQIEAIEMLGIEVYEGRRLLEPLSNSLASASFGPMGFNSRARGGPVQFPLLVIDSDAPTWADRQQATSRSMRVWNIDGHDYTATQDLPDLTQIIDLLGSGPLRMSGPGPGVFTRPAKRSASDANVLDALEDASYVELFPPESLPVRWIDYSCLSGIVVSLDDAKLTASNYPEQWQAIRKWVLTGGWLCIYGTDGAFGNADLEEVERLLEIDHAAAGEAAEAGAVDTDAVDNDAVDTDADPSERTHAEWSDKYHYLRPLASALKERGVTFPYVWRDVGVGTVTVCHVDDPFAPPGRLLGDLPSSGRPAYLTESKYGFTFGRPADDYWDYAIPGVGRSPVGSFLVLITLFAIVVGPVNYFVLRRAKRLHAMLVTVPLGAAIATLGLVVYVILWDGLGVQASVHSFTELDQKRGRAVSWSRQSYYAALVPSGGMSFPADAAVFPVEMPGDEYSYIGALSRARMRTLQWGDDQRLASGYLSSRSLSQFLVIASTESRAELRVVPADGEEPLRVENRLGTTVERLLLCGSDGRCYQGANIEPGATVALESVPNSRSTPYRFIKDYEDSLPPAEPAFGLGSDTSNSPTFSSRTRLPVGIRGLADVPLDAATYVAVVERSPAVPLGVRNCRQRDSFQLIVGRW